MMSLFAVGALFVKALGAAVVGVTVLCAVLYHLGWRNDHPDGFWPLRVVLGFGGVLVAGVGLFVGSVLLLVIGAVAYLAAVVFGVGRAGAAA
jgi:hypothetical protein